MNVTELNDEELVEYHANAQTTFLSCGGHFKAEMNQNLAVEYADEIRRRGLNHKFEGGVFNGPGSY